MPVAFKELILGINTLHMLFDACYYGINIGKELAALVHVLGSAFTGVTTRILGQAVGFTDYSCKILVSQVIIS